MALVGQGFLDTSRGNGRQTYTGEREEEREFWEKPKARSLEQNKTTAGVNECTQNSNARWRPDHLRYSVSVRRLCFQVISPTYFFQRIQEFHQQQQMFNNVLNPASIERNEQQETGPTQFLTACSKSYLSLARPWPLKKALKAPHLSHLPISPIQNPSARTKGPNAALGTRVMITPVTVLLYSPKYWEAQPVWWESLPPVYHMEPRFSSSSSVINHSVHSRQATPRGL